MHGCRAERWNIFHLSGAEAHHNAGQDSKGGSEEPDRYITVTVTYPLSIGVTLLNRARPTEVVSVQLGLGQAEAAEPVEIVASLQKWLIRALTPVLGRPESPLLRS